jgi:hypothetical protein
MTPSFPTFVLLVAAGASIGQATAAEDDQSLPAGLSVTLDVPTATFDPRVHMWFARYKKGEPVVVGVRLANNGDRVIELSPLLLPQAMWLSFEVNGPDGREVRFLGPRSKIKVPKGSIRLEPGCFWGSTFNLAELFDLRKPGTYSVRAAYRPTGPGPSGGFAIIFTEEARISIESRS